MSIQVRGFIYISPSYSYQHLVLSEEFNFVYWVRRPSSDTIRYLLLLAPSSYIQVRLRHILRSS